MKKRLDQWRKGGRGRGREGHREKSRGVVERPANSKDATNLFIRRDATYLPRPKGKRAAFIVRHIRVFHGEGSVSCVGPTEKGGRERRM